jgi:hypothetical protein
MDEQTCLSKMTAPGTRRPGKYREGVVQIWVTRACDKSCFSCTQGSNLAGKPGFITVEQFDQACLSLEGYWGVVGMFGGNPCIHPEFDKLCEVLRRRVPFEQRGLWSNNLLGKGRTARETFNPAVSNLNVHLDRAAFEEMRRDWPEAMPCGLSSDSRHSPTMAAMKDLLKVACPNCRRKEAVDHYESIGGVDPDCEKCGGTGVVPNESRIWELISGCDINQHWSAMVGVFRGQLRAWFCEIAGAQAMLHQHEDDYPDTGVGLHYYDNNRYCSIGGAAYLNNWWQLPMEKFADQVRKHCFDCGVPLRGHGQLSQDQDPEAAEQVSEAHKKVYRPKRPGRRVEVVADLVQLGRPLAKMTDYIGNAKR